MTYRLQTLFGLTMLALFTCQTASAEPHCAPTERVIAHNYPGAASIPTGNNLLLPAGKAVPVEGQRLILTGHLLDSRCVPIPNAVVELWQPDPFGHWYLAQDGDLVNPRPTFAGAGRTITDINGQFNFITAFPGVPAASKTDKSALTTPHVNVRIDATGFAPSSTVLFFQNDRRNAGDATYSKLSDQARAGVTLAISQSENGDLNGQTTIILPGKAPYRTY